MAIPTLYSTQAYVKNLDTGVVYYTKGQSPQSGIELASITKLMTAYVARQVLTANSIALTATVTVAAGDIESETGGGNVSLASGDVISWEYLLFALLVASCNTAGHTIGRECGNLLVTNGGLTRFVTEMNTQATNLGMSTTTFVDSWGLGSNTSTSTDIYQLLVANRNDAVVRQALRPTSFVVKYTRSGTLNSQVGTTAIVGIRGANGSRGAKSGSVNTYHCATYWEAPNGQTIAVIQQGADSDAHRLSDFTAILTQLVNDFPALATAHAPFTPAYLFSTLGYDGAWFDFSDTSTLFQDTAGTTPATANNDPVGRANAKAHGATAFTLTQGTSGKRPLHKSSPGNVDFDGSDDYLDLGTGTIGSSTLFAASGQKFMVAVGFIGTAGDQTSTILAKCSANNSTRTFQLYWDQSVSVEDSFYIRGSVTNFTEVMNDGSAKTIIVGWDGAILYHAAGNSGPRNPMVPGSASVETQNVNVGSRTSGAGACFDGGVNWVVLADNMTDDAYARLRDWANGATVNAFADPTGGSAIKTRNGLAWGSVKTLNGLAVASIKTVNGVAAR